jgi:hypothetical protein
MARIRIDQVQEGMELASDVTDKNGQVLVRAGATITARELRLFNMWGVADIDIAGLEEKDTNPTNAFDPDLIAECEPIAREMFQHNKIDHPFVEQIFQECIVRIARQKLAGGLHGT